MQQYKKIEPILENWLLPMVLFVLSFYDYNRGIDLADAGYSISYFKDMNCYDGNVIISTFWSTVVGNLFMKLPYGASWAGISFYCTFIIAGSVLFAYFFCKKYMNIYLAAASQVLAICFCWNPTVVVYDYLSFFLFEVGIICIFAGIEKEKRRYFFLAGLLLGMNVFVRLPNITECAAIVLVWVACFVKKESLKTTVKKTAICIGGYAIGIAGSLLVILGKYGFYQFKFAIYRMMHLSQSQSNYSIWYMATETLLDILKYWKYVLVLCVVAFVYALLLKLLSKKLVHYKYLGIPFAIAVVCLFEYWRVKDGLYDRLYTYNDAIVGLSCLFFLAGVLACLWNVFSCEKLEEKLLALTFLGVFYVTPLGSNNHIYLAIMNMFLLIPIGAHQIYLAGKRIVRGQKYVEIAVFSVLWASAFVMICNTLWFGKDYIYHDAAEIKITDDNVLKGMKTTEAQYEELKQLMDYFESENLSGSYGITYCDAPGLQMILDLKPVMSSPWADFYTYAYDDFYDGTVKAAQIIKTGEYPVLILNEAFRSNVEKDHPQYIEENDKYLGLLKYINDYQYECRFRTENYAVYLARKS